MADSQTGHDSHEAGHGHPPARPFARLRLLLRPERRDVIAVVVFALAVAVLSLATPIAVESLVNTVAFGILLWPVVVIAGVLMSCLGLAAAIRAMQVYVVEYLQRRIYVRVVADYAQRLPRLRLDTFDHRFGPELANRFFDVVNVQKSLATLLLDGIAIVVTAVVGMVVLAFYHPFLLGFDVVLLLMIAFVLFVLGWGGVQSSLEESHAKYDVAAWLEEVLRCLRPFKFAGGKQLALERADQLTGVYVTNRQSHFRVVWRQTVFALGLQVVASTALLGLGGWLVIDRQLTLGQLVAAELIVALVVASVAKLGKYAEAYYDLMAGAEKLGLITDLPLEREGGEALPDTGRGIAIQVRGLGLGLVHRRPLPSDWHVRPNEHVAIDGPHGSGKTTLFEMVCGLRDAGPGTIELNGIDVRSLSLDDLRRHVGFVERADLFLGTVMENVRVGRAELTPGEVRAALQAVDLLDVVLKLPRGLDTVLMPTGSPLSATQSMQLTIARVLVGQPRLLILDTALDAIDLSECPRLLPLLFDRSAPWTLLVVSTNPEVIRLCDRVLGATPPADLVPLTTQIG